MDIDLTKVSGSYVNNATVYQWFSDTVALGYLLLYDVCILDSGRYIEKDWDGEETIRPNTVLVFVNCSDIFAWGCCDAEELPRPEIRNLFHMWYKDKVWGSTKWCCLQRKLRPQQPIIDDMKKDGSWDDEMESLPL